MCGEFPTTLWLRLQALLKRRQLDRDIEEEMQFHMAMREQRSRAEGVAADEARTAARRQFGNVTSVKEACRNLWTFAGPETLLQDVRFGARLLRRSPGFTAIAALALGLGIGATTAIYSMCEAVLWRPVPLPHLEKLVVVLQALPGNPHMWQPASPGDIDDVRRNSRTLESLASWQSGMANLLEGGGEPVRVQSARVTANFFDVLGVKPTLGRVFLPEEEQPGHDREVVLSDNCWRRRYAADPHITGKTTRLNDRNYSVVGVMPPLFAFPRPWYELWTPLALTPEQRHSRSAALVDSIGRLKAGSSLEQAAGELRGLAARLAHEYPDTNSNRDMIAWPVRRYLMGDYVAQQVRMLLGGALFVLLIACTNVANLQFARRTARWREVAVRISLGAGRRRVVRQLVTESMVLATVGAAGGLLFAHWGVRLIKAGVPPEMRQYMAGWEDLGLNAPALAATLAAAVLSGILAGLAPAWRCSRPNLTESLKEGGSGSSSGRGRHRLRTILVAGEIALATILLVGAGLMVRAFRAGLSAGRGLEPANLLTFHLALSDHKYHENYQVSGFYRAVLERMGALPGVRSTVAVTALPYSRHWDTARFTIEGRQAEPRDQPSAQLQAVSPSYFPTMRIPLLAGRFIAGSDDASAGRVAVISRRSAKRWWPGGDPPLGQRIRLWDQPVTIIGVVEDIESSALNREPGPTLYVPCTQSPQREMDLALRTDGDAVLLAPAVRSAIRSIDPEQPITNLNTLAELIRQESFGLSTVAVLMGVFGAVALALATIGVYGVMAYLVSERTHEIGIRMALGASRAAVLATVFRRGMVAAGAGLIVGMVPAYGLARLMASVLWGVSAADPFALVAIPLALGLSAALAIYIPARRATKLDPLAALREE